MVICGNRWNCQISAFSFQWGFHQCYMQRNLHELYSKMNVCLSGSGGRLGERTGGRRGEAVPLLYISLTGLQSITQISGSHSIAIVKYLRPFQATLCAATRDRCRTLQFRGRRLRNIFFGVARAVVEPVL
jgi:hypothetical protein